MGHENRSLSLGEGNGEIIIDLYKVSVATEEYEDKKNEVSELSLSQLEEDRQGKLSAQDGAGDILSLTVIAAHGLRNTDRGLFRRSGDASDPYVIVNVGKEMFRSKTIN